MSKRQKQRRAPSQAHDDDKPQYAADYMTPKQKPKKKAEIEDTVHVQEHLQNDVLGKLKDLKQKLTAEEETVKSDAIKVSKQGDRSRGRSMVNKRASAADARKSRTAVPSEQDKREKSFAELFDPVEEDEASFDDLLKESKLDWRKFK